MNDKNRLKPYQNYFETKFLKKKAFNTTTGMPYGTINLKKGVPKGCFLNKFLKDLSINNNYFHLQVKQQKPGNLSSILF